MTTLVTSLLDCVYCDRGQKVGVRCTILKDTYKQAQRDLCTGLLHLTQRVYFSSEDLCCRTVACDCAVDIELLKRGLKWVLPRGALLQVSVSEQ